MRGAKSHMYIQPTDDKSLHAALPSPTIDLYALWMPKRITLPIVTALTPCYIPRPPQSHLTKNLWAHNSDFIKFLFAVIVILMMWSGYNFALATTAKLSWHVQNCELFASLLFTWKQLVYFTRFGLWAHKQFVEWASGHFNNKAPSPCNLSCSNQ